MPNNSVYFYTFICLFYWEILNYIPLDPTCQLDVLWHQCYPLHMYWAQISILEKVYYIGFCCVPKVRRAIAWNLRFPLCSWVIFLTIVANGNFLIRKPIDFWNLWISNRTSVQSESSLFLWCFVLLSPPTFLPPSSASPPLSSFWHSPPSSYLSISDRSPCLEWEGSDDPSSPDHDYPRAHPDQNCLCILNVMYCSLTPQNTFPFSPSWIVFHPSEMFISLPS